MPERKDSDNPNQEEEKENSETSPKPRFPHSPTTLNGWGDRARDAMRSVFEHDKKEEDKEDGENKGSEDE